MKTILFLFHSEINFLKYVNLVSEVSDYGYLTKSLLDLNINNEKVNDAEHLLIFTDKLPKESDKSKFRLLENLVVEDIISDINIHLCVLN